MLEVVETCAGSQFENIGLPKLWDRAEQQFSPHYDGSARNPRLSGPPTPRLGKKGGGRKRKEVWQPNTGGLRGEPKKIADISTGGEVNTGKSYLLFFTMNEICKCFLAWYIFNNAG